LVVEVKAGKRERGEDFKLKARKCKENQSLEKGPTIKKECPIPNRIRVN